MRKFLSQACFYILLCQCIWGQCVDKAIAERIGQPSVAKLSAIIDSLSQAGNHEVELFYSYRLLAIQYYIAFDNGINPQENLKKTIKSVSQALSYESYLGKDCHFDLGKAYHILGVCYKIQQDYKTAEQAFVKSAGILSTVNTDASKRKLAEVQWEIGNTKKEIGDYSEAKTFLSRAIYEGLELDKTRIVANAYLDLGDILNREARLAKEANFQEGVDMILHADSIYATLSRNNDRATAHNNLAIAYQDWGKYDKALSYYQKALDYYLPNYQEEASPNTAYTLARLYNNMSIFYNRQNAPLQAHKVLDLATKFNPQEGEGSKELRSMIYHNRGEAFLLEKNYRAAIQQFEQGIQTILPSYPNSLNWGLIEKISDKRNLLTYFADKARALNQFASTYDHYDPVRKEKLTEAKLYYQRADSIMDMMRKDHQNEDSKLFWRKKAKGIYEDALEVCFELGDTKQAYAFFEKSKAVLLLDAVLKYNPEAFQPNSVHQAGASSNDLLITPIYPYEAIKKDLAHSESQLIHYFYGKQYLYMLKMGPQGDEFKRIKKNKELEGLLARLTQQLEHPDAFSSSVYRDLAFALHQKIFAPLSPTWPRLSSRIFIAADDYLNFIPFDALLTEEVSHESVKDYPFVLQEGMIQYVYSATFSRVQSDMADKRKQQTKGIAFAPFSKSPGQHTILKGSQKEVNHFPGKRLKHTKANKKNFMRYAPDYDLIHLATHASSASSSRSKQDEPAIYFVDPDSIFLEDTLRLSEIYKMHIPAKLVVLSACETGLGHVGYGEGIMSLARGFSYAGTSAIVSSLWQVEDQGTAKLIQHFYQNLSSIRSPAFALHQAKLKYLSQLGSSSGKAMPYYWAGLVYTGSDLKVNMESRFPWIPIAGILIGAFVLLYVFSGNLRRGKS